MTKQYFDIDPIDALYNAARKYPGGVAALAVRLGRSTHVMYNQLSPGVDSHHLSPGDFFRVVEMCAQVGVEDAFRPLHAACFQLGHIAVPIPALDADLHELFQDVLEMLSEEGEISKSIQWALSEKSEGGKKLTAAELAEIELHVERSMAALAGIRRRLQEKHRQDYPQHEDRGGGRRGAKGE